MPSARDSGYMAYSFFRLALIYRSTATGVGRRLLAPRSAPAPGLCRSGVVHAVGVSWLWSAPSWSAPQGNFNADGHRQYIPATTFRTCLGYLHPVRRLVRLHPAPPSWARTAHLGDRRQHHARRIAGAVSPCTTPSQWARPT
jgi:hypothetical protein